MRIKYYLELDVEDEKIVNDLEAISDAERTTLDQALHNVLQNFFAKGGVTPCFDLPVNIPHSGVTSE